MLLAVNARASFIPNDLTLGANVFTLKNDSLPRGIRNNNPLNIRENDRTDWDWQGEALVDTDSEFEVFTTPEYGIRAATRVLMSYRRRGIVKLSDIVATWAPPNENDTPAYVASVAKQTGFNAYQEITAEHYPDLLSAMIYHENGLQPYSETTIRNGVALA